jgi:hypothetical protein
MSASRRDVAIVSGGRRSPIVIRSTLSAAASNRVYPGRRMMEGGAKHHVRVRVLFFLRAANFDRIFECFLRELLTRGHEVHVAFDKEKGGDTVHVYEGLSSEFEGRFFYEQLKRRRDRFAPTAAALRRGIDYLRYLEPEYENADALRSRARSRAPWIVRALVRAPGLSSASGRSLLDRALRSVEAQVPVPGSISTFIESRKPDVVLVSPLVEVGSLQGDYIRAARSLGIPTMVPVASWDNLTNKGLIRDYPDRVLVWNEAQVEEAVQLHRVPRERVVAVGAHTYDHWFLWRPTVERQAFLDEVGLRPGPYVLYVCSSGFIAPDEVVFVCDWVRHLRKSDVGLLRDIRVLIRPHPQNAAQWQSFDEGDFGRVAVYPRGGAAPTDTAKKAAYYDSLHHCVAVVGINTSALIEAAIVRKPVFTILTEEFRNTQEGTLHFSHLTGADGVLSVARNWDEHFAQLAAAVAKPEAQAARSERFLRAFVRPRGLERAASPIAVDCVESVARMKHEPAPATTGNWSAFFAVWGVAGQAWEVSFQPIGRRLALLLRTMVNEPRDAPHLVARFLRTRILRYARLALVGGTRMGLSVAPRLPQSSRRFSERAASPLTSMLPKPARRRWERVVMDATRERDPGKAGTAPDDSGRRPLTRATENASQAVDDTRG